MNVLIVEDDVLTAASIEKNIKSWGYGVEASATGKDALKRFEQQRFNIVILSVSLPDIASVDLISQLKDRWHRTGIIVISEDPSRELEIQIREQGVMEYLIKPIDLTILKEILAHLASKETS
jgi:DNA-binding response OmpR family regulator